MASIDEKNYEWFKKNLPALIKEYRNQFIVVHEESMKGAYPSFDVALTEALKFAKPGEFLIQRCATEDECTQIICSLMRLPTLA